MISRNKKGSEKSISHKKDRFYQNQKIHNKAMELVLEMQKSNYNTE